MNDDRLGLDLAEWMKAAEYAPPDAQRSAHQVATHLPKTRQLGRRRWLPWSNRKPVPARVTDTTEYQPSSIPATNGQSPTVIGRTQSMFSPTKAITAGALVFAIGGVMLIAQPFGQQGGNAPGAENVDYFQPVRFAASIAGGPDLRGPTCQVVGGVTQCRGQAWSPVMYVTGDSRLAGQLTVTENKDTYQDPADPSLVTQTYRVVNDDGAWQGSYTTVVEPDGPDDEVFRNASIVLVGEDGYAGLYAWMDLSDWNAVSGVIFPAPPPEAPVPPPDE